LLPHGSGGCQIHGGLREESDTGGTLTDHPAVISERSTPEITNTTPHNSPRGYIVTACGTSTTRQMDDTCLGTRAGRAAARVPTHSGHSPSVDVYGSGGGGPSLGQVITCRCSTPESPEISSNHGAGCPGRGSSPELSSSARSISSAHCVPLVFHLSDGIHQILLRFVSAAR
jgi:hypothetical protein